MVFVTTTENFEGPINRFSRINQTLGQSICRIFKSYRWVNRFSRINPFVGSCMVRHVTSRDVTWRHDTIHYKNIMRYTRLKETRLNPDSGWEEIIMNVLILLVFRHGLLQFSRTTDVQSQRMENKPCNSKMYTTLDTLARSLTECTEYGVWRLFLHTHSLKVCQSFPKE